MLNATLDTSELEKEVESFELRIRFGLLGAVANACQEGAEVAKREHRYKDKSRALTGSIEAEPPRAIGSGGKVEGAIVAKAKHASYVEEGTRPHEIRPRAGRSFVGPLHPSQKRSRAKEGKPYLVFQVNGRWVRAAVIHHPGTRAYAFMGDAARKAEAVMIRDVEVAAQEAGKVFT